MLGKEAQILKLSLDEAFQSEVAGSSWGPNTLLLFTLFLFSPRVVLFTPAGDVFFHFCIITLFTAFMKKKAGYMFSKSHHGNFDTNRAVMFC